MAFFWRRRRKLWWGKQRRPYYKRKYWRRKRWPRRRRRLRRTARRRRRKPRKVRRFKKKKIVLTQWQPDRIRKCKIKGFGTIVLGADGKQMTCYTNDKTTLTPSKTPGGGGFGVERYTLQYLYEQWAARRNIWTTSNLYTDLCIYKGCKITFYRHQYVDFIINYSRQPPFQLNKTTYMSTHPTQMLLGKHKKILLSKLRKPNGREKLKIFIKPPKTMINKWYFQKQFTTADLFQITATAAYFSYPNIGSTNENQILNFYSLNTQFYSNADWAQSQRTAYRPSDSLSQNLYYWTKSGNNWIATQIDYHSYSTSIGYTQGAFSPKIINAQHISTTQQPTPDDRNFKEAMAYLPLVPIRYNMPKDTGEGNMIWFHSLLTHQWNTPLKDNALAIANVPIWLALWGFASYAKKHLQDPNALKSYILVIKSPAIYTYPTTSTQTIFPLISKSFLDGKDAYNSVVSDFSSKYWFPYFNHQEELLNLICESSPYVPKLERNRDSTWELSYSYCFYFKWGGPEITDQQVNNPTNQDTWVEPYTIPPRLQISNPLKQDTESLLHAWDFRRGIVTNKALERMYSNLETDTSFEPDTEEPPKKKKKIGCELPYPGEDQQEIQTCLQELCKESLCQEPQTQDLQQLIQQQREQQQQLKHNLLILMKDLKTKQKNLQLQVGTLN
nr:MAG: ORF1 [Torque teno midi virus]